MTDTELDALEAAAKAATPGPWEYNSRRKEIWAINSRHTPIVEVGTYGQWNVDYIVAANPAAVLELIEELRQTMKERDWLADKLESIEWPLLTTWIEAAKEAICQKK